MDAPRLTVALTIDHDAISDAVRRGDPPVKVSHAEFGPRVGVKRILALLASRAIPATFFVPGHTLTTFTDDTEAIVSGGHELACHGWFHEDFAELGADQAREMLDRTQWGTPSGLVEVPVYWAMDDWPHFEPGPGRPGLSAPSAVLEIWTEELAYAHEHAPGGLVMVTVHPECIGRGHRMAMLEGFIEAAVALDGVVFERLDAVVSRWAAANP